MQSADNQIVVEVKGVDVYGPTPGKTSSSSTDDIVCWFIDTNDNGESFFVRHAYFTGADEPYGKLKRALRAEIDEAAWQTLYTTVSQPFAPPETGKIAVKVINHCGDAVMKVFDVPPSDNELVSVGVPLIDLLRSRRRSWQCGRLSLVDFALCRCYNSAT